MEIDGLAVEDAWFYINLQSEEEMKIDVYYYDYSKMHSQSGVDWHC